MKRRTPTARRGAKDMASSFTRLLSETRVPFSAHHDLHWQCPASGSLETPYGQAVVRTSVPSVLLACLVVGATEAHEVAHSPRRVGRDIAAHLSVKTRGGRLELIQGIENTDTHRVVPSRHTSLLSDELMACATALTSTEQITDEIRPSQTWRPEPRYCGSQIPNCGSQIPTNATKSPARVPPIRGPITGIGA